MQAALLLCDDVDPDYQEEHGNYAEMFAALFPAWEFTSYDVINGDFPESLDQHDVYITTGSRYSAYDGDIWIEQVKALIREIAARDLKFVGVCFGHQLLAEALGGKVQKSAQGWCVGIHEFQVKREESWMQPSRPNFNTLMMCQDQVVALPANAVALAGNQQCPLGMFRIGRQLLGIQSHPEYSRDYNQLLMELRVERMGEETVRNGITSLAARIDRELLRDWIMNFVAGK